MVKRFMWEPSVARAASAPGVEAADPGFEHRSTLDFYGYCSVRVWSMRVLWCECCSMACSEITQTVSSVLSPISMDAQNST